MMSPHALPSRAQGPSRPQRLTSARGLTLVELLIAIALVALLAALLFSALRPNPDQRCKAEALRLAAFLEGAASEAKMSGGLTRVAFRFERAGLATRQVSEMSAASAEMSWVDEEGVRPHAVTDPVRLDEVLTHLQGSVKAGEASVLFKGAGTPGGVAILTLKEIAYSVVVPPRGGAVEVVRGRAPLPDPYEGARGRRSPLAGLEGDEPIDGEALSGGPSAPGLPSAPLGALPSAPLVPPPPPPPAADPSPSLPSAGAEVGAGPGGAQEPSTDPGDEPVCGDGKVSEGEECDDGNDDEQDACLSSCARATCGDGYVRLDVGVEQGGEECDDGNEDDADGCLSSCKSAVCGDGVLRLDLDPRDTGYEECDDGNSTPGDGCDAQCKSECATDADCKDPSKRGPWGACDTTTFTCRLKVPAFRLESVTSVSVTDGGVLSNLAQPALVGELQANLQQWINQGKLIIVASIGEYGQTYEYAHEVPSASFFQAQLAGVSSVMARGDLPVYRYQPTYQDCSMNGVFEHCYTSGFAIISLYIPYLGTASCDYQVLNLNTQLTLNAKPGQRAQLTLTGYITPRDARLFRLAPSLTLADALDTVEPTIDCNGDRNPDAWAITISGEATEKELLSPPLGTAPSGCPTSGGLDDCNPPPDDEELQALFDAECARCHSDTRKEGELSLARPFREKVLNQPSTLTEGGVLVRARSYEESVLYQRAGEAHGGQGNGMSAYNLTRLKDWILGL